MEERLDSLVNLLEDQSKVQHHTSATPHKLPAASTSTSTSTPVSTPRNWPRETDATFEGDSSMLAHSRFAKSLVEKTLHHSGSSPLPPSCNETLAALKQLSMSLKPKYDSQDAWFDDMVPDIPSPPSTALPPFAMVASALKAERGTWRYSKSSRE